MARDLWGLLTQARADPSRVTGFLPAADQLVFGDAVLGEEARRVVVLDRVGQYPVSLLGQFWQRRYPQDANHVLSCDLHRSRTFRLGTPAVTSRGMKEPEMEVIADFIQRGLAIVGDDAALARLGQEVRELCGRFPVYLHRLR